MADLELEPSPPPRPPFQYSLRTLLLLFVVLGSSLGVFGAWGILVFAVAIGFAVYLHEAASLRPLGYLALLGMCLLCVVGLLLPGLQGVHSGYHPSCLNRMKQVVLAMHCYHGEYGCFPPAYIADKNGKPIHSWRVLVLPGLEDTPMYKCYNFGEPWDGPKNKTVSTISLREFACPIDRTSYALDRRRPTILPWSAQTPRGSATSRGSSRTSAMRLPIQSCLWKRPTPASLGLSQEISQWTR